ncbi:Transcriptional activator spt7, partial [Rhizoclosmatium hyalinum]
MDLGTMTKKLTNLEYMSKDDFASDLSLIWSNCLTFNVQPDSIYRKKAFMMKRKSLDLLKRVPDIKIIVKPQEPESESDDDEKDEDKGGEVVSKRSAVGGKVRRGSQSNEPTNKSAAAKASNLAGSSATRKTPAPVEEPPIIINFDDDEPMGEAATPAVAVGAVEPTSRTATPAPQVDGGEIKRESTPDVKTDVKKDPGSNSVQITTGPDAPTAPTPENGPEFDEDYVAGASIQVKKYLDVTEELRKNNYMSREHSLNTPSFGDRFAVSRNPAGFQTFLESFNEFCERNIKRKSGKLDDEADKDGFFLPELTHFGTCLPHIPQVQRNLEAPTESLSDFPESQADSNSKVTKLIAKNVEFLRKIKDIHCRIIARMTDDPNLIPPPRVPPPSKTDAERSARMPDFVVTPDAADAIMTQLTSRLLMHTGFDAIQGSALAILNDIGIQYMQNLGKTLRLYVDKEDQTLSHEDILKRTLQVNGVENANKLDLYVRNDIQRYSIKLFDLKKKLSLMYKNLLESGGLDSDSGVDIRIGDLSAEIMSGNFLEDLGVDFLNLKDLGIDVTS